MKNPDNYEFARDVAGYSRYTPVQQTFSILCAICRWMLLFTVLIIIIAATSYVFKYSLPQIAADIFVGVLIIGLIISSIILMRVLWWSGNGRPMKFNEAWKVFAVKVQIFLIMIVSLLALPSFVSLARVEEDPGLVNKEAIRMLKKAKKMNGF